MTEQKQCILLLVNTLAGLSIVSGKVGAAKYVCPGDSIQLFQNIAYDLCDGIVSLSLNGNGYIPIANWLFKNCTTTAKYLKGYNDKVFLHQNRTITFHNINHFDNGNYVVEAKTNASHTIQQVQIFVMVSPGKDCRPKINRSGNTLHITGTFVNCGDPITIAYWKHYDGVADSNEPVIEVIPGNERRTYTTCMKGQALQCAHSLKPDDYCSSINIEGSAGGTNQLYQNSTDVFIVVIIVVGMLLLISAIVIAVLCLIHIRNRTEADDTSCKKNVTSFDNDHQDDVTTPLDGTKANVTSCKETERSFANVHQDDVTIPLDRKQLSHKDRYQQDNDIRIPDRTEDNVTSYKENVRTFDNDHQDDVTTPLNRKQLSLKDRYQQDSVITFLDRTEAHFTSCKENVRTFDNDHQDDVTTPLNRKLLNHKDRCQQDNEIRIFGDKLSNVDRLSRYQHQILFDITQYEESISLDKMVMTNLGRNNQNNMSPLEKNIRQKGLRAEK